MKKINHVKDYFTIFVAEIKIENQKLFYNQYEYPQIDIPYVEFFVYPDSRTIVR